MNDILIVDDEPAILRNLVSAVDWSEYGFRQIHTAQNAKEAILLLKEHTIDLLMLDIQLPDISGLELLRIVRGSHPTVHCILMSAYSKFEYAKEALQLNVENYLVKPIDINELRETVAHAANNIIKTPDMTGNLFERNFLERWLYGRITSNELIEHSQYTHYNVLMRHYYVVKVSLKNHADIALHLLSRAFPRDYAAYPLPVSDDCGFLLLGGHDLSEEDIRLTAEPVVHKYPSIRVVCGSLALGNGNVSKSLADADDSMEFAKLADCRGFLAFSETEHSPIPTNVWSRLETLLNQKASEKQAYAFCQKLADAYGSSISYNRLYAFLCLALIALLTEQERQGLAFASVSASCDREMFTRAAVAAILNACKCRQAALALSPIVQRVVSYINDNLNSPVSIKHFCELTNMNPTYIGRLFKEEMGMYFSEYVCMLRIGRAKLLLKNTTYSVSDIARQVGIYDVSYFVQCFKKQERISPMKYRQALTAKQDLPPQKRE